MLETLVLAQCQRWAYVHIPKTGGTSVISMVWEGPSAAVYALRALDVDKWTSLHHHTAMEQSRKTKRWDDVMSFSVVRNPFEWAVSQFFYYLETKCENRTCERVFGDWLVAEDNKTFDGVLLADRQKIGTKPVSQLAWISDDSGRVLVKHVVRLEDQSTFRNFSTAENFLLTLCGNTKRVRHFLRSPILGGNTQRETPHRKATVHGHRSKYYTAAACAIIARRFKVDFDAFDYDPTNCTGTRQGWPQS